MSTQGHLSEQRFVITASESVVVFSKKRCSLKFPRFHRKTPVLKSVYNKVAGLTPIQVFSCEICEMF